MQIIMEISMEIIMEIIMEISFIVSKFPFIMTDFLLFSLLSKYRFTDHSLSIQKQCWFTKYRLLLQTKTMLIH